MDVILRELNQENDTFELVVDFIEEPITITRSFIYSTTSREDILRDIKNRARAIYETFGVISQMESNISVTFHYNPTADRLERV